MVTVSNGVELIGSLPNDVALCVLARLPRVALSRMRLVCRCWNAALHPCSGSITPALRTSLGIFEAWPLLKSLSSTSIWSLQDPLSGRLYPIPPLPPSDRAISAPRPLGSDFSRLAAYCQDVLTMQWHIFCLDVFTMQWRNGIKIPPPDPFHYLHSSRFASALMDSYLYLAGGSQPNIAQSVWRIHVGESATTPSWERLPDMHCKRSSPTALVLQGRLYVVGGDDWCDTCFAGVYSGEVWEPTTKKWTLVPELWPAHIFVDQFIRPHVVVVGEKLYALNCSTMEILFYEDSSKNWISLGGISLTSVTPVCERYDIIAVGRQIWALQQYKPILTAVVPPTPQPLSWTEGSPTLLSSWTDLGLAVQV